MRVEVERVAGQLRLELGLGAIAVGGLEERPTVERMDAGKLGVERDRLAQLLDAAGEVLRGTLRHPHHQVRFGRFAALQDAVDQGAALDDVLLLQVGEAEHVGEREVVLVLSARSAPAAR